MNEQQQLQEALERRSAETREARMSTANSYAKGDWLGVADTRQTYDRLVRKGQREAANELLALTDKQAQIMRSAPFGLEAMPAAAPADGEALARIGEIVHEAVIGVSDIMPVNFLHEGSRVAHSIGRIITFPHRAPNGTGFLISPRLLLTNNHVLADAEAAGKNIVQFNFYVPEGGGTPTPAEFRFQPELFFLGSPIDELDFALVAVEEVNKESQALAQFGWNNLVGALGKAQQGERLNIIHHPQGLPQQVTIRENFLALMLEDFLHYVTDTEPGSSGSPVFNEEWEVVALHHAARNIFDQEEIQLYLHVLRGVQPAGASDPGKFGITINEGMRISKVVNRFKELMPTLRPEQRPLLEEALRGDPPPSDVGRDQPIIVTPPPDPRFTGSTSSPQRPIRPESAGDVATWTIPLQVSVSLGGLSPVAAPMPSSAPPIAVTPTGRPASDELAARLELFNDEINNQKSVFRALAFLQEARERDDYVLPDETLAARKQAYYGQLIADAQDGLTLGALYDALHELLRGTLKIVGAFPESLASLESLNSAALESGLMLEAGAQYARARAHLYTWVDLREDRMLRGIYTGTLIAPEQLMLKDLITQLGHSDLLPRRFRSNQFLNCEHIVPQSWFNKAPIGVSDLHHLITADGAANNFRSDCAYREFNVAGEEGPENRPSYIPAAGKKISSAKLFEPGGGKPVVARATLYFLMAHKGFIDSGKYGPDDIETLKDWAKLEAPSRYELHRNEAIFEAQGNRNPLIDFPDWIDLIDFTRGVA